MASSSEAEKPAVEHAFRPDMVPLRPRIRPFVPGAEDKPANVKAGDYPVIFIQRQKAGANLPIQLQGCVATRTLSIGSRDQDGGRPSLVTAYAVKEAMDNGDDLKRKPGSGGHNKQRTDDFIAKVKTKIDADTSMRDMASKLKHFLPFPSQINGKSSKPPAL
eukprot:maker-scaffold14_size734282-snap-gene-2.25 protein:Tk11294 transcript:maker-scaffold14_size734282-snap-gene-2.25-mRNA-1 annotation:"methionyl-trna formyltransferase"